MDRIGPHACAVLAKVAGEPNVTLVDTILATSSEPFRARMHEQLLEIGGETIEATDSVSALAALLDDHPGLPQSLTTGYRRLPSNTPRRTGPVVVTGDDWAASRPFVRVCAAAGTPVIVSLTAPHPSAVREALAIGASAVLNQHSSATALGTAFMAVRAGLVVLDPTLADTPFGFGADHTVAEQRYLSQPRPESDRTLRRPLTTRERQILSLVASGTSNKGIARALGVSSNTVKFHLAAVFQKLGTTTRAEAVAEAIRRGDLSV